MSVYRKGIMHNKYNETLAERSEYSNLFKKNRSKRGTFILYFKSIHFSEF